MPQTAAVISGIQRTVLYETRAVSLNELYKLCLLLVLCCHVYEVQLESSSNVN